MIVKNPNSKEVEKIFSIIEKKRNHSIMDQNNGGKHWDTISSMTEKFGMSEIDLFNDAKMNTFKKSGWIESRVFFSTNINAFALTYNNLQYLGFNFGLLYSIRDTFLSLFSTKEFLPKIGNSKNETSSIFDFQNNFLKNRKSSNYFNLLPKCEIRKVCADSMTNITLFFVYAHEVLHLAQCHSIFHKQTYGIDEFYEFPLKPMSSEQSFDKRALETEADLGGMRFTMRFIHGMKKFGQEKKFQPYSIYFIWISAIEVLFKVLNPFGNYAEDISSTHPNHLIRIINIYEKSLSEAISMNLVKDAKQALKLVKESNNLNSSIFNKIGFTPRKISTPQENQDLLNEYRKRCNYLLKNELRELIEQKNKVIKQDYENLLKIKNAV